MAAWRYNRIFRMVYGSVQRLLDYFIALPLLLRFISRMDNLRTPMQDHGNGRIWFFIPRLASDCSKLSVIGCK